EGSAVGRDRRRLLLLDEPARDHLSPAEQHSRGLGNRRERAGDGVRQHGRDVGHRRRLHPQSVDRRERALWRVPRQRAGRGRGGGHPHAAEHHRSRAQGGGLRQALARSADAGSVQAVRRNDETPGKALQGLAGPRVHCQRGKLWMLQTRNGKRTARAALKVAVEMANEGLISREDAITRVEPAALDQLLHPMLDPKAKSAPIATGLPASPGAATGAIVFSAADAEVASKVGRKTILVRVETSPEDIGGMHAAEGILTTRGGMTSHAAVVARGMGKPCVAGTGAIRIDYVKQTMTAGGVTLKKGDVITIDGAAGQVMQGRVPMVEPELSGDFTTLMGWADAVRRMKVRANAETPTDARVARSYGAEGIGLARTEHMFFEGERIVAMREMILSDDEQGRRAALAKLLPMQRQDFAELFEIMTGLPVTIRLLD